jgi:hypothetical protein
LDGLVLVSPAPYGLITPPRQVGQAFARDTTGRKLFGVAVAWMLVVQ